MAGGKEVTDKPKQQCAGIIPPTQWRRARPCSKAGKYERDGKFYCGTHEPEKAKARQDKYLAKSMARYSALRDERAESIRQVQAYPALVEEVARLTAELAETRNRLDQEQKAAAERELDLLHELAGINQQLAEAMAESARINEQLDQIRSRLEFQEPGRIDALVKQLLGK